MPTSSPTRIAVAQFAPTLGNIEANVELHLKWIESAQKEAAQLLVFPELSLTGYYLRDMVPEVAQPADSPLLKKLAEAAGSMDLIVGFVEETAHYRYHNAAAYISNGAVRFIHRKVYLPTYGMFDEQRYFAAGQRIQAFDTPLGRIGLLICEDFWHLSCGVILQAEDVDCIICTSNSPVRGVSGDQIASAESWRSLNRCCARFLNCVVIFANRVGFEEGVGFWGGSEVVGPDGAILAQAPELEENLLCVDYDRSALRRARISSPLGRDENLFITIHELERIRCARFGNQL